MLQSTLICRILQNQAMRFFLSRRFGKLRKLKYAFLILCAVMAINVCLRTLTFWRESIGVKHEVFNIRQTLVTMPMDWEPRLHHGEPYRSDVTDSDTEPDVPADNGYSAPSLRSNHHKSLHIASVTSSPQRNACNISLTRPYRSDQGHEIFDAWWAVDVDKTAYVFSAYEDPFTPYVVTIIGAMWTRTAHQYFCQIWTTSHDSVIPRLSVAKASTINFAEGHEKKYNAAKLHCTAPINTTILTVSVTSTECQLPLHVLGVRRVRATPTKRKFTICVPPLNFKYGRAYELVEWLELNLIFGADKIVFYNHSTSPNVDSVLKRYVDNGLVDVIQWKLPMTVNTWPKSRTPVEIHYFGQMAAMNDCFLRNAQDTEYIVNEDLDEFIVPVKEGDKTWNDILRRYSNSDAFLFQNVFFRKEWNDTSLTFERKADAEKYRLVTLLKTLHESKLWPASQRSKYIYRPKAGVILGIHDIRIPSPPARKVHVSSQVGLLHHYRNWENLEDGGRQIESTLIIDKYKDRLIDQVRNVWEELSSVQLDMAPTV